MAVVQTLIGNVKGPQGEQGATGATGPQGDAATITVGSVSTTAYGNPAQVVNVGTENEAILNFVIPQGKPGQATTTMGGLTLDTITTSTADFPSPQVGDTGATAFGKIVKFFADALNALNSKLNTANVVNNLTTTEAGYALDARAGKTLNDSLTPSVATITDSHFSNITITKCGGVKTLCVQTIGSNTAMSTSADYVTYFTLPDGYRPQAQVYYRFQGMTNNTPNNWLLRILTTGEVAFANYNAIAHPGFAQIFTFI